MDENPKRRWFQFRLSTCFLLALAIVLGLYAWQLAGRNAQLEAENDVLRKQSELALRQANELADELTRIQVDALGS